MVPRSVRFTMASLPRWRAAEIGVPAQAAGTIARGGMRAGPSTLTFGPSIRIIWTPVISRPLAHGLAVSDSGLTAERCRDARGLPEGVVLGPARPGTWFLQGTVKSPRGQGPAIQRDLSGRPSARGPAHRRVSGAPVPGLRRGRVRPAGQPLARTRCTRENRAREDCPGRPRRDG